MLLTAEQIRMEFIREGRGTNRFTAVQETDFTLEPGKLTVLKGRSGSGKSTLLNILSGLLPPTTGTVTAGDTALYTLPDGARSAFRNRHIGVIPQGQTALFSLTVLENVCLPVTMFGGAAGAADDAKALLERLEIASLANVYPAELSGGELRRMAIARALLRKPELVFADEPTGDLDEESTAAVFQLLRETAEQGAAVLVVTHETAAEQYADKMYQMAGGVLTAL